MDVPPPPVLPLTRGPPSSLSAGSGAPLSIVDALRTGTKVRGFRVEKGQRQPAICGAVETAKPGLTFSERKAALDREDKERRLIEERMAQSRERAVREGQARNRRDLAFVYTEGVLVMGASTESLLALAILIIALSVLALAVKA
jgi:hypothetical protein